MQGFSAETQGRRQPDVTLSSIHQIPFRDCLVCGKGEGPLFFQSCVLAVKFYELLYMVVVFCWDQTVGVLIPFD